MKLNGKEQRHGYGVRDKIATTDYHEVIRLECKGATVCGGPSSSRTHQVDAPLIYGDRQTEGEPSALDGTWVVNGTVARKTKLLYCIVTYCNYAQYTFSDLAL